MNMHSQRIVFSLIILAAAATEALQLRPVASKFESTRCLFATNRRLHPQITLPQQPLRMSTEDVSPDNDVQPLALPENSETSVISNDDDIALDETRQARTSNSQGAPSGGVARTLLLAAPLFFKFVIVLCIKFLTDLVVFPLLFLYRMARLVKRKILKAVFPNDDKAKNGLNGRVNGATGSSSESNTSP
ncbi:hypothetical protein MPSEU_000443200 [Mayamaea pseudoterrestris]|nr:hypothetical protein MPSEU_000443200 [Mayamaea pseudoterrestris]